MKLKNLLSAFFFIFTLGFLTSSHAKPNPVNPFPPFHIIDNIYFVGNDFQASYLIVTPKGNILINSDYEHNVPLIKASIQKLGFDYKDTKILLISHAHSDHAGGSALIKQQTGAKYMVMDRDVPVVESGGKIDFHFGKDVTEHYRATKVDRVLHDGDQVKLGDTVLVAHLTAGHSKGTTTWTTQVKDNGKLVDVVIDGSLSMNPGYKLVHNTTYPTIAEDYKRTFRVTKALPCTIFLAAHGMLFGLKEKYALLKTSKTNPFIDPAGYKKYIAQKENEFQQELNRQLMAEQTDEKLTTNKPKLN